MRTVSCEHLLADATTAVMRGQTIAVTDGIVDTVLPASGSADPLLVMPVLVNAHDHGRAIRTSSIGAAGKPLESWINYLALFPSVDPYLAAVVSLAKSALGGVGCVMMHYTRAQGFTDLPREAAEVARAARDVGIRVGFAPSMRDMNPLVYGPAEPILAALPDDVRRIIAEKYVIVPRTPAEHVALADAVAEAAACDLVDVQYGPNGVQWCSEALLEAIAEASARTGRRVHMHLLETQYQRQFCDAAFPQGVVRRLDEIGLLSERLTLAHCVWARPDELELLAERGVTIAVNTSSNLHLHSGIAPLAGMLDRGCRVALGIDAGALDDDDDALREMRLAHLLHVGNGFDLKVGRETMLKLAVANGRYSVTSRRDGGRIAAGEPADLLMIDWDALDDEKLRDDLDPLSLVFARCTARHIREVMIAGRTIVKGGVVQGVDVPAARAEVLARMRAGMAAQAPLSAALTALEPVLARHYEPDSPCC